MAHLDIDLPQTVAPETKGEVYRDVLASAKVGDTLELCEGVFDTGQAANVKQTAGVKIIGQGSDRTFLLNSWHDDARPGCAFELNDQVAFSRLTLNNNCLAGQQGQTVGFGAADTPDNCTVTIDDCRLIGRNWCLYSWGGSNGSTVTLKRCSLYCGRVIVGACRSSGGDSQYFDLIDCDLHGDSSLSTYQGEVGNYLTAFACRGGRIRALRCTVDLVADPTMLVARGAWVPRLQDLPNEPHQPWNGTSPHSRIEIRDSHFNISGGQKQWDADGQIESNLSGGPVISIYGGTGSDSGQFMTNGNVLVNA